MRATLLALALVLAACQTTRAERGPGARTVEGRVEEVGQDEGTVTLRVGEERREILVAPEAEIRIDDFKGTFEDIKEGQRVRASIDETGVQREGFRIQILDRGVPAPGTDADGRAAPGPEAPPGVDAPRP